MKSALLTRADKLFNRLDLTLPDKNFIEIEQEKAIFEESLYEFAKAAWSSIEPGVFVDTWHLQILAEHLEELYYNRIKYLVINMPPRTGKSLMINVIFPAWVWAKDPSYRLFYTAYSEDLAVTHSDQTRTLIGSEWYKQYWGDKFSVRKDFDNKNRFDTDKMGYRMISTVQGKTTGFGGDIIFVDDPNNVTQAESELVRNRTNLWWSRGMVTRWGRGAETFRKVVVQQRVSVNDLTGNILSKNNPDVVWLRLPMKFEADCRCVTVPLKSTNGKRWKDPRKREGELLCPNMISKRNVDQLIAEFDSSYAVASQLQQRPLPKEGGTFKQDWFNIWTDAEPPKLELTIQSWDTAFSDEPTACYSACTTWGVFNDKNDISNLILLNLWRGRLEYPELRRMAQRLAKNYHDTDYDYPDSSNGPEPDIILVEYASSGHGLIPDLRAAGISAVKFDPRRRGNKKARAAIASTLIEGGRVWLPGRPPNFIHLRDYSEALLRACLTFPSPESDDIVDSMSQVILYLKDNKWISHPSDYVEEIDPYRYQNLPLV
jgi:phage terminase large subunit-like protein